MASFLTSDQVNYLIWRYLQESGFRDSAYTFERDSKADRLDELFKAQVQPGHLIYLIQRGLQYEELRSLVERDGTVRKEGKATSWLFLPTAPVEEDEGVGGSDNGHMEEDADDEDRSTMPSKSPPPSISVTPAVKKHGIEEVNGVAKKRRKRTTAVPTAATAATASPDGDITMVDVEPISDAVVEEPQAPRVTNGNSVGTQMDNPVSISPEDSIIVGADDKTVSCCAWNPANPSILATGGQQSSARIWTVPSDATDELTWETISHEPAQQTKDASITTLRWSPGGRWLASGSYDGQTRIWSQSGILEHSFSMHFAPVSNLRWNMDESMLLALSCDGKVLVWDILTGQMRQGIDMPPSEMAVSVEWITLTQYIASGDKGGLHRYDIETTKLLNSEPQAHTDSVECLEYDPVSALLATAGQDRVVKIWRDLANGITLDAKLEGHTEPIVALAWQPNSSLSSPRLLASASVDRTVRLWDVISKQCLRSLNLHMDPIEYMCFSPSGEFIASGANGYVIIWQHDQGHVTHIYDRKMSRRNNGNIVSEEVGEVLFISWDADSARVAVAEGDHKCAIFKVESSNSTPPPPPPPPLPPLLVQPQKMLDAPPLTQELPV